jgi:hemolysin activation/secretion protein
MVEGKYLRILRDGQDNFGARLTLGHTSARSLQHYYFLGGLRGVRGFPDSRFRGRKFWQANVEYRIPGLDFYWDGKRVALLQHNFFIDSGRAKDKFNDLFNLDNKTAHSVGTGVRFILPGVHRFIGRLDFAYALQPDSEFGISFGAQQFF